MRGIKVAYRPCLGAILEVCRCQMKGSVLLYERNAKIRMRAQRDTLGARYQLSIQFHSQVISEVGCNADKIRDALCSIGWQWPVLQIKTAAPTPQDTHTNSAIHDHTS